MTLTLAKSGLEQTNKYFFFLFITLVGVLLTYIANEILITDDLVFDFYADRFAYERVAQMIEEGSKWKWIVYPMIPSYYLIKFFTVAICVYVGMLFIGHSISFVKIFHVAMFSEVIFFIPTVIKLIWFTLIQPDYSFTEFQYFLPLSALNFFNPAELDTWLIYPLQILNVFEVLYWLALALGVSFVAGMPFPKALGIVTTYYGSALLLWMVFIVFLIINTTSSL